MADEKTIVHPLGDYVIASVGPTRDWDFNTDQGKIAMKTFSIQLEGIADWVDFNQKSDADAPKVGDKIRGHVEDAGKFGMKFQKEKKQGNWGGGGGKYSAGAAWSAAYENATAIVVGFYTASGKKPKDFASFIAKIDQVAPSVKAKVDELAKGDVKAEDDKKSESESGESAGSAPATTAPAPTEAPKTGVDAGPVNDDDLGDW